MLKELKYYFMSEKHLYRHVLKDSLRLKGELSEEDRLKIHDELFAIMDVILNKHACEIDLLNEIVNVLDESIIKTNERNWRA